MSQQSSLPDLLSQQFGRVRKRLIGLALVNGLSLSVLVASLFVAGIIGLDLLVELPRFVRVGFLFAVPIVGVFVFLWHGLFPAVRRTQQSEIAAIVDAAHPELRERLLTVVELAESSQRGEDVGSPVMQQMLLNQTMSFAQSHDFSDVLDGRRVVRSCWMGGIALIGLLLPLLFATEAYASLLTRFLYPWGNEERIQNLVLTIEQPDRVVGKGDDVEILVYPSWRFHSGEFPKSANINWTHQQEKAQFRRLDWNEDRQCYSIRLPRIMSSFDYDVSAAGARTRQHRIEVVERPNISRFIVDVIPPAYTGLPAERYDPLPTEIEVIEQSRLELELVFDRPVVRAEILWLDGSLPNLQGASRIEETVQGLPVRFRTELPISDDGLSAVWDLKAALDQPSGRFVIRVFDVNQLTSRQEMIRRLTVRPDMAPRIEFVDLPPTTEARPNDILRLRVNAVDDYGLATVELHCEWLKHNTRESLVIPVPESRYNGKSLEYEFQLDLSPLDLEPGTPVTVRARATDERPIPGPNESWTNLVNLQIRVDAKAAGDQQLAEKQDRLNQAMDQLRAGIEKQKQSLRKQRNQAQASPGENSEKRKDQELEEVTEQIRKLSEQLDKLSAVLEQQPVLQSLAERAKMIGEQSLSDAAEQSRQAADAEGSQKQKLLSKASDHLQKAGKDLDAIQKEFQQFAQMQRDLLDLNRIADQVEKLATDVEGLNSRRVRDARDIPARQQWQQEHRQLVSQHQSLEGDLETVLEKHPGLMDKARESLQQRMIALSEQAERLARQQQSLADSELQKGSAEGAEKTGEAVSSPEKAAINSLDYQLELLQQAKMLSSEVRQLGLKDSILNRRAPAFPDAARQTSEALQKLNFDEAAENAAKAAERSRMLAEELSNPEGPAIPERLQQRATEVAETQQAVAKTIQQLAESPTLQQEFFDQLQQRTQQQMADLTGELKKRSRDFKLDRIDRDAQGELAEQAGRQSAHAESEMKTAADERQKNQPEAATEATAHGVEALRRAAHLSRQASEGVNAKRPTDTDVPGEVGRQIAESSRRLSEAGELLSQLQDIAKERPGTQESNQNPETAKSPSQQDSSEQAGGKPSESSSKKSEDGSSKAPGEGNGKPEQQAKSEGKSAEETVTSTTLREAAQGLRLAAEQMGIARNQENEDRQSEHTGRESQHSTSNDAANQAFTAEAHLQALERSLGQGSHREWGKLPGTLQTEMIESAQRTRDPAYRGLIRRYFEEISKTRAPDLTP